MRNQAGLSQTISEQARVIQTMLSSGSYSQKEFTDAWDAFKRNIDADLVNLKGGHRPEALEIYEKNTGGRMLESPKSKVFEPMSMEDKQRRLEELRAKRGN